MAADSSIAATAVYPFKKIPVTAWKESTLYVPIVFRFAFLISALGFGIMADQQLQNVGKMLLM